MVTSTRRPLITSIKSTINSSLCNSIQLKSIIDANLSVNSTTPQLSIHSAIKAKFRGEWIVFCLDKSLSSRVDFVADQTSFCSSHNEKTYVNL
ncbi:hypothetical protein PRIPAC_76958 [Pristionchus pacificus]|uniref:Uncharacterized protein n=1 Tax=Pristionchus pacificus TaxID=54126 RepID=A0A454XSI3_PRIPA|nr:hypothetical protein PRIPAC_76958 [Pristionchus pacificus]|eukprot:PDM64061.1 hypothetical protein PRIPAC_54305 [Pristionchus pacificus]